jgi:nitrogen regulatory protein P-II 2
MNAKCIKYQLQHLGAVNRKDITKPSVERMIEVNLLKKIRIEIAVNEDFVEPTIEGIIMGARIGKIGDGKIT